MNARLAAIALFGFALRLFRLDWQSAWIDELFTYQISSMDLPHLLEEMVIDYAHPPLHMLWLHFTGKLIGYGIWQLRFLSALCGAFEVYAAGLLAGRLFPAPVALLAAFLISISQAKIYESQEARPYALACLLCTLASYWLLKAIEDRRPSDWWKSVFAICLMLNTHYYTVFVLAAMFGFALWHTRHNPLPRLWWLLGSITLLVSLIPWFSSGVISEFRNSWTNDSFPTMVRASALSLASILNTYNGGKWLGSAASSPPWTFPLGLTLFTAPAVFALKRLNWNFAAALWLIPMLGIFSVSWALGLIFYPRYAAFALIPYWLLVAFGLYSLPLNLRRFILPMALLYAMVSLRANYAIPWKTDYKSAIAHLAVHAEPDSCLVTRKRRGTRDLLAGAWNLYSNRPPIRPVLLSDASPLTCPTLILIRDDSSFFQSPLRDWASLSTRYAFEHRQRFRGVFVAVLSNDPAWRNPSP